MEKLSQQGALWVAKAYYHHVVEQSDGMKRFEGFHARFEDGEHKLVLRMGETDEYPALESHILCGIYDYTPMIPHLNAVYPTK